MYIYLAFALVGGFLLANQNPINADLRKIVGSPFLAWNCQLCWFDFFRNHHFSDKSNTFS